MPYVTQKVKDRIGLEAALTELTGEEEFNFPACPGELNYVLTCIIKQYIKSKRPTINYDLLNEVAGVLDLFHGEFVRRIVHPYEDKKIQENGDVWDGVL